MANIRGAIAISLVERYIGIGLSIVSFVVLARLLTPHEVGLFSLAATIIAIAQVVRDFGVVSYLIQEKELTAARIRTAFGITCLIAGLLFALTFLGSAWAARFYSEPQLADGVRILSLNFLLAPFGSTGLALLRREMRFTAVCAIGIASNCVNVGGAVLMALSGFGYLSPIWASVAASAVSAVMAMYLGPRNVSLLPTLSEWRRVLRFGSRITLTSLVTEAAMSINDLAIGRVLGVAPVAIVNRAQGVMNVMHRDVLGAVSGVMFPAMSQVQRDGGDVEAVFRRTVAIIGVVAWPFYGALALLPMDFTRLMFGPQWDEAAALVPIFCVGGACAVFWKITPAMLQAMGRVDLHMRVELFIQPVRIAVLLAVLFAYQTLFAYAIAFALVYGLCIPAFEYARRIASGRSGRIFDSGLRASLKVTALTLIPAAGLVLGRAAGLERLQGFDAFCAALVSCAVVWLVSCKGVGHPIARDPAFGVIWRMMGKKFKMGDK